MGTSLKDMQDSKNFRGLLIGEPGAGKTTLMASFAKLGPLKVFDFDGKISSAGNFFSDQSDILENIDVEAMQDKLGDDPIERFLKILDTELIPAEREGKLPFKTLCIDSITTFSSAVLKHIVKSNPGIKRVTTKQGVQPGMQDYGILKREFTRLIPGLLGLNCNIIMTAHVEVKQDELTKEILRLPVMDGSFSNQLGVYFDEVWYLSTNGKGERVAQTQADFKYKFCRSQIKGLPNPMPIGSGYDSIKQYIN